MKFIEYAEFSVGRRELIKARHDIEKYILENNISIKDNVTLFTISDDRKSIVATVVDRLTGKEM